MPQLRTNNSKKRFLGFGVLIALSFVALIFVFMQKHKPLQLSADDNTGSIGTTVAASIGKPSWRDEFNSLSFASENGGGNWRTRGHEGQAPLSSGYTDYAGQNWNATEAQIKRYGLATVSGGVLTLKAKHTPKDSGIKNRWMGPYLVSNHKAGLTWRYGYFEWRASLPNSARGMFPALWLFNNIPLRTDGYQGAEIDMFEVFGQNDGEPWEAGLHFKPKKMNGKDHMSVLKSTADIKGWHRYGVEWTANTIAFYRDGKQIDKVTGDAAEWFRKANLGIRINYAMDPKHASAAQKSTDTQPSASTTPTMKIDYIRYYSSKPSSLPQGTGDPL